MSALVFDEPTDTHTAEPVRSRCDVVYVDLPRRNDNEAMQRKESLSLLDLFDHFLYLLSPNIAFEAPVVRKRLILRVR